MADFDKEYDFMLQRVASLEKRIYGKKHGTINNDTKV